MNMKKVSIIIPIYNASAFIRETIESVLQHSIKDIELILVDDGSTDHSYQICQEFVTDNIKLFHQENSGVSVARNFGLSKAEGEYIFFMDADDTLDTFFIESSYLRAKKENSDILVIGEYFKRRFPDVMCLPTCAMFIRHKFLKKYPDIRFPIGIQPCEDGLFSHQLLALTLHKVGFNPKGIYHYRKHPNQNHIIINKNIEKVLSQIPLWFKILEDFYSKNNLFENKALHLALFLEHEPFEFRYLGMPLDNEQKKILFRLIKDFMHKNVFPFLSKKDMKKLSIPFVKFLQSEDNTEFDIWHRKRVLKGKILRNLIKFIPIKKMRKDLREKIQKHYMV